ncbi:MAG: preprotein translocase subunit SecG [Alphaproteobacteria bacterium]|nr:MAG: preprotein translocase subunit SecG [Alphaproteobacteria bacterium]
MQTVIIVIHLMVVLAMTGVVLLQRSEGGGLGMGNTGGFLTSRGSANVLTRTTAGTASRIRSWKGRIPRPSRGVPPGFRSRLRRAGAAFSTRCANKASRRGSKASRPLPPRRRRPGRRCRNRNSGDIQRAGVPALRLSSKWDSANRG